MAEAVVGVLICKLGEALLNKGAAYGASLLCTETSALKGFFGEIHRAMGWMEIMKAYLRDSEKLRDTNETTDTFVKKIRGLAFRIEDVVDEYEYKLQDGNHGRFAAKMKKRLQHGKAWRRLARELRDINADLEDTARQKNLCAMPEMARYGGGNGHDARSLNPTLCFARNEDLVGIENNAEKLKGWLLDNEVKSKIVTVWGMGGAGKTTLVDHVYKIVKEDFDVATWELYIQGAPELSQVEIEEGALKSLVLFELSGCPELKCLPRGTEYLTALEELCLLDTSEELIEKLRQERDADHACNEELMKIRHIRRVVVK
ncbi:hypothetical protein PR202_gb16857 [Eleusine coracana subsp. coracana]|uniref:Uncharacterized protein n=1 Tax=Eleusine coracana subsp. coracana TaxID=191504 RepID=A0AAV5F180_ELECO|nr:hypothetical protein PR202_gb16857 [Eleusine coracana subsp. coracana]